MSGPKTGANLFRDCVASCGAKVHCNAKVCPNCGARSPWAGPEPAKEYVVTEGFSCMVGVSLRTFKSGEPIREASLIEFLLKQDCPIRARADTDKIVTCPHCHETYLFVEEAPLDYTPETREKLERLGLIPPRTS